MTPNSEKNGKKINEKANFIVLFFSTSALAETWTPTSDKLGLEYWQSSSYEVVDVKLLKGPSISTFNQIYTLTHPEGGFKICTVLFATED